MTLDLHENGVREKAVRKPASLDTLRVKLFADGADRAGVAELAANPLISGFTTNPTLMHKAGIRDYEAFALEMLTIVGDRSVSFEVFADDFPEMKRQAHNIAKWGSNVYVKIPVTNTLREPSLDLIRDLARDGIKLNVTALMTLDQVERVATALAGGAPSYISVFAGRVADTGVDPVPLMRKAVDVISTQQQIELIWASPRELLNVFQADEAGVHIITATHDILTKLSLVARDLIEYSLDTVKMFRRDALAAGFTL